MHVALILALVFPYSAGAPRLAPVGVRPHPQGFHNMSTDYVTTEAYQRGEFRQFAIFPGARASMALADLASTQALAPGIYLANTSASDIGRIYEFLSNNPYNQYFAANWDSTSFGIYDLDAHRVVRDGVYGAALYVPRKASVDALVSIHVNKTLAPAWSGNLWNGLYIDSCPRDYPHFELLDILAQTAPGHHFDIDGDGVADDTTKVKTQYAQWCPYLLAQLRASFPDKILIANSAGPLDNPSLNGITIEAPGDAGHVTIPEAIAALRSQAAVGRHPTVLGVWPKNQANALECKAIQDSVPGAYYLQSSGDLTEPW